MIRQQNAAGIDRRDDVDPLGDQQVSPVPHDRLQQASRLVQPLPGALAAAEDDDADPARHRLVDRVERRRRRRRRGGRGAIEYVVGVELEDEGGDLDLRALVAAGEERPGLREPGPSLDRPEPVARERAGQEEEAASPAARGEVARQGSRGGRGGSGEEERRGGRGGGGRGVGREERHHGK